MREALIWIGGAAILTTVVLIMALLYLADPAA
jgi:hypothetical protein